MHWKQTVLEFIGDALRFVGRACVAVNVILLGLFSVWFCVRFLWFLASWLNRSVFDEPW